MNEETLNVQSSSIKLAKMGMLGAISLVLVYFVHFPIFPAVAFLEYDPADVSILLGTFAFGPLAGFLLTLVVSVIQGVTVSAQSGIYGIIMHLIATGSYVLVAGNIYSRNKTRKGAIVALAAGVAIWVVVMYFANLFITPAFMGAPVEVIKGLMPFILGFNFIKAGLNSVITFILYKKISGFLHR
ncbi:MAG: ECF transporter S component [Clostridia bacterium]|nr:ECF transporter S component [Clostridia bacterium]